MSTFPDDPSGDYVSAECLKLKRQLNELVDMTTGLEEQLLEPGMSSEDFRNLKALKDRYAREAVELMMRIDMLEDPEDEDFDEDFDDDDFDDDDFDEDFEDDEEDDNRPW